MTLTSAPNDRLDSWKEISVYLRRGLRTVQRWEKAEGLPVHRHLHDRQSSVYAFKSELDAWQESRGTALIAESGDTRQSRGGWLTGTLLTSALVIALAVVGLRLVPRAAVEQPPQSLAVLPFENVSGTPDEDYLAFGISERIVSGLSSYVEVRPLSNAARVGRLRPDAAGRALGVDAVLTGRLGRQSGTGRHVLSVELIDVRRNASMWNDRYEMSDADDLLSLDSRVGHAIAARLRLQMAPDRQSRFAAAYTSNEQAYREFLKGRFLWNRRTASALNLAIAHFNKAQQLDPEFALAYSALGDAYISLSNYTQTPAKEAYPHARAAAVQAIAADPRLAEAHVVLAAVRHWYDWDFEAAGRQYRQALELRPDYATGFQWYAEHLLDLGRFDEALVAARRAEQLDPLSLIINTVIGNVYLAGGDLDQAIAQYQRALQLDPHFGMARLYLGRVYLAAQRSEDALRELREARRLLEDSPLAVSALGHALARVGADEARSLLRDIEARARRNEYPAFAVAHVHIGLGNPDAALLWLAKAVDERYVGFYLLKTDPVYGPLRDDPRFVELLRRMNLEP